MLPCTPTFLPEVPGADTEAVLQVAHWVWPSGLAHLCPKKEWAVYFCTSAGSSSRSSVCFSPIHSTSSFAHLPPRADNLPPEIFCAGTKNVSQEMCKELQIAQGRPGSSLPAWISFGCTPPWCSVSGHQQCLPRTGFTGFGPGDVCVSTKLSVEQQRPLQ